MSPPPSKDWWLAAALTGAALPTAFAQQTPRPDGVVTTVPAAGAPQPGSRHAPLVVTQANGQRIVTDDKTSVHVLFPDQSALTVGPNSDVVLQQYQYDPKTKDGNFVVQMSKGVLRVVGGFISKNRAAQIITPTATVGIRGGIGLVEVTPNQTFAAFLFGLEMTMQQQITGLIQSLTRPGFFMQFGPGGFELGRLFSDRLAQMLARLEGFNFAGFQPIVVGPFGTTGGGDVGDIDPERLEGTTGPGGGPAPNLNDLLGSPGPGNQS
jgi:hypothetical protein